MRVVILIRKAYKCDVEWIGVFCRWFFSMASFALDVYISCREDMYASTRLYSRQKFVVEAADNSLVG